MSNQAVECKHGFTLIGLSIVIVVISLIIGGVLVGQDLIKMSEARALMSQMDKYQAAVHTFQLKYNCKPGDCKNATMLGLGPDGNGDRYLGATTNASGTYGGCLHAFDTPANHCLTADPAIYSPTGVVFLNRMRGEMQNFWVHLSAAHMIDGEYATVAINNDPVDNAALAQYLSKDALGKNYLAAFSWGKRLYIRTGVVELNQFKHANVSQLILSSGQMNYIADKYGIDATGGSNAYEALYLTNKKILPLGFNASHPAYTNHFVAGNYANQGSFTPCTISDGSGGYKYNIQNNGSCNLMWELDY